MERTSRLLVDDQGELVDTLGEHRARATYCERRDEFIKTMGGFLEKPKSQNEFEDLRFLNYVEKVGSSMTKLAKQWDEKERKETRAGTGMQTWDAANPGVTAHGHCHNS